MKKYWFICMGRGKGECEPYSFPVPPMLDNDAYVKADLAEEMLQDLRILQNCVEIDYPGNHTLINRIKHAIKKVEEP